MDWSEIIYCCQSLWLAKIFWCFSLIQLLRIRWNMVEILLVRFSFLTDRKSNIATAAWDWLRHFEILLQVDNRISQKIAEKFVVRCWSCCYFLDRWKSKCGHQILYHMRHFEFLQIVLISWNMAEISLIRCWPGVVTFNLNGNPIWSLTSWGTLNLFSSGLFSQVKFVGHGPII